ncbi:flagellar brake domain-containing protein [Bacillus shivajii]|uniref:flagellar brake protein n=1 Tax=Bacillus shivajii TaxID=1983719 RepID=UPI001CFC1DB1|nr:flagellar brake domain-containing protein [Bacillus shivajii]UCZ54752.1 flagellar brake domain-containing protein [Bacillus shivajii]
MVKVGSMIFLETNNSEEDKKRYRSKILDYAKERIYIDFPVDEQTKKPKFFLQGTQFRAWFLGEDGAIYVFQTEVLGKVDGKLPMLILDDPGKKKYVRIQRRQYVRVDTSVDVAIQLPQSKETFTSISLDISGGGMAIHLPHDHNLNPEDKVDAWLSLAYQSGEISYMKTKARLVRVISEHSRERGSFEFVDISEHDRQMIVRYCFEKQMEMRRKSNQK